MSQHNDLAIEIYSSGTTLIKDPRQELRLAENIRYSTYYPGGLYGAASFFVPHPPIHWWELAGGQRVVIRNKQQLCYEGYIANLQSITGSSGEGVNVNCIGAWGHILMNWRIRKRWCDDRVTDDVWNLQTSGIETEEWQIERQNRIHITPQAGQFASGEYVALRYTSPAAQTVKRLTYDYDFAEKAGQSWEMSVWRSTDASSWTQMATNAVSGDVYTTGTTTIITATAAASIDVELATASRYLELRFYARANNNPVNDDHNHGLWSSLKVYSETGAINMEEIAKDIAGNITALNSDTRLINAAGTALSLEPFIADDFDTAAEVIDQAASQGDGDYNRWAAYILGSETAFAPDGKPLLALAQYLETSDYEYAISLGDKNLVLPLSISQDFDSIANSIRVRYTDPNGVTQWRTAVDNAALRDDTSIATYGRHEAVLSLGMATSAIADATGQRYLASYKDPQYRLNGPITVQGYIRGGAGNQVPTSQLTAGVRVRIEDYLTDVTGTGQGLTFIVTQTAYDNDSEVCQMGAGVPDAPLLLRYTPIPTAIGEPISTLGAGGGGSGGGGGGRTITDAQLDAWGLTRKQWWAIKGTARGQALRASIKKKKKKG